MPWPRENHSRSSTIWRAATAAIAGTSAAACPPATPPATSRGGIAPPRTSTPPRRPRRSSRRRWQPARLPWPRARRAFGPSLRTPPWAVAALDLEGRVLAANPALERLLGRSKDALLGHLLADYGAPGIDREALHERYRALVGGDASTSRGETRWLRADGRARLGQLTTPVVRDTSGAPRFAICMIDDITEERQARAALIQAERLNVTGQLTAAFAHEIKNPLQAAIAVSPAGRGPHGGGRHSDEHSATSRSPAANSIAPTRREPPARVPRRGNDTPARHHWSMSSSRCCS